MQSKRAGLGCVKSPSTPKMCAQGGRDYADAPFLSNATEPVLPLKPDRRPSRTLHVQSDPDPTTSAFRHDHLGFLLVAMMQGCKAAPSHGVVSILGMISQFRARDDMPSLSVQKCNDQA